MLNSIRIRLGVFSVILIIGYFISATGQTGPGYPECDSVQTRLWDNIHMIRADRVWEVYGITGSGVITGAIDMPIDPDHPDYQGIAGSRVIARAHFDNDGNIITPTPLPDPSYDPKSHGMWDAGVMIGGNGIGVAPGAEHVHASWVPEETADADSITADCYNSMLYWLANHGARVINLSFHMGNGEWFVLPYGIWMQSPVVTLHQWVESYLSAINSFSTTIDSLREMGVFLCVAAGNNGPGAYTLWGGAQGWPKMFCAGNVDSTENIWEGDDVISVGSSWGPAIWPDTLAQINPTKYGFLLGHERWIKPDIVAPGVMIYTTHAGDKRQWQFQMELGCKHITGTSPATPHVTGTAALMLEANPNLTVDEIENILRDTAVNFEGIGPAGPDSIYGYGRLDAFAAVTAALDVELTSNTPTPDVRLDFCDGHLDTFVLTIDLPDVISVDEIPESLITLVPSDPPNSTIRFISDGPIYADSAATQANGFTTTITHSNITGAGADLVSVAIDGAPVSATAPIYVLVCEGSGGGKVKPGELGDVASRIPRITALGMASPNPFTQQTSIPYQLSHVAGVHIEIAIYDAKGRLIYTLVDKWQSQGMYNVSWDGRDNTGKSVSSGVYFYRMKAGTFIDSKKLLLIK